VPFVHVDFMDVRIGESRKKRRKEKGRKEGRKEGRNRRREGGILIPL